MTAIFAKGTNRVRKTKGCLKLKTALSMAFRLILSAWNKWRKTIDLNCQPQVIKWVELESRIKQPEVVTR